MRVYWRLLAWTMSLIIAKGIVSFISFYMFRVVSPYEWLEYSRFFHVIETLIYPILFVAVLYLIGRNLDLKGDLPTILLSLFIGCLVALIVNSLIYLAYSLTRGPFEMSLLDLLITMLYGCYGLAISLITQFFVGFGALALGFLTAKKPRD